MLANATISSHAVDRFLERIEPIDREDAATRIRTVLGTDIPKHRRRTIAGGVPTWDIRGPSFTARVVEDRVEPEQLVVVTVLEPRTVSGIGSRCRHVLVTNMAWARGGHIRKTRWRRRPEFDPIERDWLF